MKLSKDSLLFLSLQSFLLKSSQLEAGLFGRLLLDLCDKLSLLNLILSCLSLGFGLLGSASLLFLPFGFLLSDTQLCLPSCLFGGEPDLFLLVSILSLLFLNASSLLRSSPEACLSRSQCLRSDPGHLSLLLKPPGKSLLLASPCFGFGSSLLFLSQSDLLFSLDPGLLLLLGNPCLLRCDPGLLLLSGEASFLGSDTCGFFLCSDPGEFGFYTGSFLLLCNPGILCGNASLFSLLSQFSCLGFLGKSPLLSQSLSLGPSCGPLCLFSESLLLHGSQSGLLLFLSNPGLLGGLSLSFLSGGLLGCNAGSLPLCSDSCLFGGLSSGFPLCSFFCGETSSFLSSSG